LSLDDAKTFTTFYDRVLRFSYSYRTNSQIIVSEDDNFKQFYSEERNYFYQQKDAVIEAFVAQNTLSDEEYELIEAIKEAKFGAFFLLEYGEKNAVISDDEANVYNVQMLSTPFNQIFTHKPMTIITALIPYKNRYILDGRYGVVQEQIPKKAMEEIRNLLKHHPEVQYQKENNFRIFATSINLTLFCDALHFEEMEDIVRHCIPDEFTQNMVNIFADTPFEKTSFVSSFIRTMDYLHDVNGEDEEIRILNGLSISNHEVNGEAPLIPSDILNLYYKQKPLDQSISRSVYEMVQYAKKDVANGAKSVLQASSFYSMLGVFYIQTDNINEFEFLEYINSQESREVFNAEIEKLFEKLNKTIDFKITPIFLDFAIDLDSIIDEIDDFREYMGSLLKIGTPKQLQEYSIYKGKKPKKFNLFH
ncbi:MAG: hypothetical protein U9N49_02760, partial [Campylobacterota bacterium]|nr:hypothetical protein [Campylobacterota bacterium]